MNTAPTDVWARPAVRLHPMPGTPAVTDSHIGGPVLWPADEPWPYCDGSTHAQGFDVDEDTRGVSIAFTAPVQLFRRDFPELPFPAGTDLLQVLLCPLFHAPDLNSFWPDVRLVWRDSAAVTSVLADPPEPAFFEPAHRARPCVLNPCRSVEYPTEAETPEGVSRDGWPGVAQATKIGGWAFWYASGPGYLECPECDTPRELLLSLNTIEHAREDVCPQPEAYPVGWQFAGDGALNIWACPKNVRHPIKLNTD